MTSYDWASVQLVVFDVDGTLYQQRMLRRAMLMLLIRDAIAARNLRTFSILADYRRARERFADAQVEDFEEKIVADVAERANVEPIVVTAIVEMWINTRPLAFLLGAIVPGVEAVFAELRRSGKIIGIFSDYPAERKLAALGLAADHIVAARDVGIMKPSPRGLQAVMTAAGVSPAHTLMIGDRIERDIAAADACGVPALLRSRSPVDGQRCFTDYLDPLFAGVSALVET